VEVLNTTEGGVHGRSYHDRDLAKSVFQAHGADEAGAVVFRKKLAVAFALNAILRAFERDWIWAGINAEVVALALVAIYRRRKSAARLAQTRTFD
jgi:hypothetical protein